MENCMMGLPPDLRCNGGRISSPPPTPPSEEEEEEEEEEVWSVKKE